MKDKLFLVFILLSFMGCENDHDKAMKVLEEYCSKAGAFYYDKITSDDLGFIKHSDDFKNSSSYEYSLGGGYFVDKYYFEKKYNFEYQKTEYIDKEIGLKKVESIVYDKGREIVLSRAVSFFLESTGRMAALSTNSEKSCPHGKDGSGKPFDWVIHAHLLRETFKGIRG